MVLPVRKVAGAAQVKQQKKPKVTLSEKVERAIQEAGLPMPQKEYRFHPVRKWRFDLAYPEILLAIEIDGTGRHNTVAGMAADNEKINEAQILGWTVIRANAKNIAATGKPGTGKRKLPYEPLASLLARAYRINSVKYMTNVTCFISPES